MNRNKVLIAGVAGFLGSHLADTLVAGGVKVVGLDNWSTGKRENISHLLGNPLFDFVETDITHSIPKSLYDNEWLAVVHTVNTEVVKHGTRIELQELLDNSIGVKNLLDLVLKTSSRFVLTSTIDIYKGQASQKSLDQYFLGS